ncbi:MAG TPA: AAA family ATPase, partial [Polyangiales bacterium]|nr:AAA family ATPase [Polyangiales bacterium]
MQVSDGSPALARSIAIVCKNLVREPSELLAIGRFELLRTLGRGGHGVVYEAFDPQRRANVALKLLHGSGPTTLYRLKREFRALAELHHPNLVALHELSVGSGEAHFTMDLIAGRDLLGHVQFIALTAAEPLARLRDAFGQLYEGVRALHCAGKLHRDLKPSNVRVSEAGRVVLLDFGLVDDAGAASEPEGTRAYMAPEQARGAACEQSDWFAFGRMLAQALDALRTGAHERLDGAGHAEVLALEQLARRLCEADPQRRPEWPEIGTQLGAAQTGGDPPAAACFVARRPELERLSAAFARSREQPVLVRVRGEPGAGKSALVERFVQQLRAAGGDPLLLRGRCYEREALPYKALDSAIDELSRELLALPEAEQASFAGDHDALLALFPVLGRARWLGTSSAPAGDEHRLAQQARGFAQLRALLARLSARRSLLIWLDDLQWADEDSGRLLGALLCEEDAPRALIVATDRTPAHDENVALEALQQVAELSPRPLPIEELELEPLAHADALRLAQSWLGARSTPELPELEQLVHDARGNPRALHELARARLEHESATSLETLIEHRLRRLPPPSWRVLQLLAAAGRPLPARVVAVAAGMEHASHAQVQALRALGLLRAVLRNADEWLELEHERIANAVLARLETAQLRALYGRLVLALQAEYGDTSEALIEPYLGAGMPLAAAGCARALAERALGSLAFARAARLFETALQHGRWSDAELAALHHAHARALEDSGRGLPASAAYARAAALRHEPHARAQLEERAAE